MKITEAQRAHARERAIFADLEALWSEAAVDNWAGRDGKALLPGAYWKALDVLEAVLPIAPSPELTVDNDGEVEMDWLAGPDKLLSLSIAADGRLTYTFRDGARAGSVTERFDRGVPPRLAAEIAAVTRKGI
ncbi:MAG: hypothetical protein ACRD04_08905 [Terriglobales bacterium]